MRGNDKVDKRSEVNSDHRRRSKFSLWASGGDLFFDVFMVVVSLPCQQPNIKILTVSRVTYQNFGSVGPLRTTIIVMPSFCACSGLEARRDRVLSIILV